MMPAALQGVSMKPVIFADVSRTDVGGKGCVVTNTHNEGN